MIARPSFDWASVAPVAARFGTFEFERLLPSERDQNFLLRRTDTSSEVEERVVLKVHNPNDSMDFVQLQNLVLERAMAAGASCQRLLRTVDTGEAIVQLAPVSGKPPCQCRALSFLPGRMLAEAAAEVATSSEVRDHLFSSVGKAVGRVSSALIGFEHSEAHREFPWDLSACGSVISLRSGDVSADRRPLLDGFLARYHAKILPKLAQLRRSIAHNDPNDYNLVVNSSGDVGVLDFGDLLHTYTCADAAICIAYLLFHIPPEAPLIESMLPFVRSFHAECPLEEAEVETLFGLALMRVCTSVCMSAYQSKLEPDNEYLLISAKPAWALLARVATEAVEDEAPKLFREVCGFGG